MSRMTNEVSSLFDGDPDEPQTTMPQIKTMTKGAWAVFEIVACNPNATQKQIAKETNLTRPYVSRVVNSKIFKDKVKELRTATILERVHRLSEKGLDRAIKIVEDNDSSDGIALDALKVGMSAMGLTGNGGKGGVNVQVNTGNQGTNVLGVTADMVNEARERRQARLLEGKCEDVTDGES